jgi:16S rRNA (cytidine1402-2'-O)-methyltransferase
MPRHFVPTGPHTSQTDTTWFVIEGQQLQAPKADPGLHIVATPIGNLGDITIRALQTLAAVDVIACEDTRHSRKLTDHYGIRTTMLAYHEHNAAARRPELLKRLADGSAIALISDAGTPLVSDPGLKLVQDAVAQGHRVIPLPGPSALLTGLVAAGLATDRFLFCGFLPTKAVARKKQLSALAGISATLAFYEAPGRVGAALSAMSETLGHDRKAVLGREMTKKFETFERGTLQSLATRFADEPIKGECVLLVAPPSDDVAIDIDDPELTERLAVAVVEHGTRSAAERLAAETGLPRRALYQKALRVGVGDA